MSVPHMESGASRSSQPDRGEGRGRGGDRSLLASVLLLVVLLAGLDLWSTHHFGFGIREPGALAVFLAAAGAAWGVVGWLLTGEEKVAAENRVRRFLRVWMSGPAVILVLYAASVVAVLLFSSVTVVAESGAAATTVVVTSLRDSSVIAQGTLGGEHRQLRFGVETSPIAGAYLVRATGYLPALVEAAPLWGGRVRLGRDVARAPGLLVRPAGPLLGQLRDGGWIRVYRQAGDEITEVARSHGGDAGSFLMGRNTVSLGEREPAWERQLLAAGVTDLQSLNGHLEAWSVAHVLPFEGELARGDTLLVQLVSRSDRVAAERRVVLRAEDVEDVFLRPTLGAGGPS